MTTLDAQAIELIGLAARNISRCRIASPFAADRPNTSAAAADAEARRKIANGIGSRALIAPPSTPSLTRRARGCDERCNDK